MPKCENCGDDRSLRPVNIGGHLEEWCNECIGTYQNSYEDKNESILAWPNPIPPDSEKDR